MLDVRRLRVLREVAQRGSFSAAAVSLNFTQSAISQQIAALEREAGAVLLERSARGVRLTEAGEALVRHTDVILARLADAEAELQAIAGLRGGRVRIATFPTAGASLVPLAVARFREHHPQVELHVIPAEPPQAIELLRAGEADVALLIETVWGEGIATGIDRTFLLDDPMYLCVPRGHPAANKAKVNLSELCEDAWMTGSGDSCPDCSIFLRACERANFEPRIAFRSDDYNAIQGFVAAGMGVALIPDLALTTVREDVAVRNLGSRAPVRRIVGAKLEGGYCSPAAEALMGVLVDAAKEFAGDRRALALAS